jgi:hypothetical protein
MTGCLGESARAPLAGASLRYRTGPPPPPRAEPVVDRIGGRVPPRIGRTGGRLRQPHIDPRRRWAAPKLMRLSTTADATRSGRRVVRSLTRTSCRSEVYIGGLDLGSGDLPRLHPQLPSPPAGAAGEGRVRPSTPRSPARARSSRPTRATPTRPSTRDAISRTAFAAPGSSRSAPANRRRARRLDHRAHRSYCPHDVDPRPPPVLWLDAITLVQSGFYAADGVARWNRDLVAACARHPTMRCSTGQPTPSPDGSSPTGSIITSPATWPAPISSPSPPTILRLRRARSTETRRRRAGGEHDSNAGSLAGAAVKLEAPAARVDAHRDRREADVPAVERL